MDFDRLEYVRENWDACIFIYHRDGSACGNFRLHAFDRTSTRATARCDTGSRAGTRTPAAHGSGIAARDTATGGRADASRGPRTRQTEDRAPSFRRT